jgi:Domain of unknown function (DUF4347)
MPLSQNLALQSALPTTVNGVMPGLSGGRSLLFIDAGVTDVQTLVRSAAAGTEVYLLGGDAIGEITQTLVGRSGIESLQIVSHGRSGGLRLGESWLDLQSLPGYVGQLKSWGAALSADADILLYGCNVGQDAGGRGFVELLAQATGSDVAASDDLTGNGALGGDWNLEYQVGLVQSTASFTQELNYQGLLGWAQVGGDIDGEAINDYSGNAISLSADGKTVAVGATGNQGNGWYSGHVRVYQLNTSNQWVQLGADIDGEATNDYSGHKVTLSADGKVVAIGAPFNDANGNSSGHVRVYQLNTSNQWVKLGSDIDGEAANDYSGYSVSLSADGSTVAIGAERNNGNGSTSGQVRAYKLNGTNQWVQLGIDIDGEASGDFSGTSVSLSADGKTVAIGARGNDANGIDSGHVRIYQLNTSNQWIQLGNDIDGEATYDYSSQEVQLSADGKIVAISSFNNDGNGNNSGHVRVYQLNTSNQWAKLGADIDGEASEDESGFAIALSADGKTVAIGAPMNDGNGMNSGHLRIYRLNTSNQWVQLGIDIDGEAIYDSFGRSVALSADGNTVAGGARFSNGYRGHARVFQLVPNDSPSVSLSSAPIAYNENATPTFLDSAAIVTDTDSPNFDTGTLTVRFATGGQPADRLSIQPQITGPNSITLDGRKIRYGTQEIATYTGGIGSENLVITFNTNATAAIVQTLIQNLTYANASENPGNSDRTIELVLTDGDGGTSTPVTKTVKVTPVNDLPLIGARQVLYDGTTAPGSQGWTPAIPVGVTAITSGGVTTVNTNSNAAYTAGFSRFDKTLNAAEGFALSFQASVLSETLTATADKNLDGKTDRAAFSLTLVTSDNTKAIELGFSKNAGGLRIFAQEDGTKQINPGLEPDTATVDRTRQLFTQAEGISLTDPGLGNYDLYVKDDSYTLFLNGTAVLAGKLRNYTAFTGPIDPYERPNLIAFSDNTPSASGSFQLGRVALLSGAIANQTMNEDGTLSGITFGAIDVETYSPTVTVASSNTTVVPNGSNLQMTGTTVDRSLTIYPGINQSGNAIVTLTANDGSTTGNTAFNLAVDASNDAPSFTASNPLSAIAGSGVQTIANWATFNPGGGSDESGQTAIYQVVSNSNSAIFAVAPAIAPNGTLTYTPSNIGGSATIGVLVKDNGGTANGGVDTSSIQTYTITVNPQTVTLVVTDSVSTEATGDIASYRVARNNAGGTQSIVMDISGTATAADYLFSLDVASVAAGATLGVAGPTLTVTLPDGLISANIIVTPIDDIQAEDAELVHCHCLILG